MKNTHAIQSVLLIGAGPIVIDQSSETDYASVEACHTLRELHIRCIVVNSDPATIMSDKTSADVVYTLPLTADTVKEIILKEKIKHILPTFGGERAFDIVMELAFCGFLAEQNIQLLGIQTGSIHHVRETGALKQFLQNINEPTPTSKVVSGVESALQVAKEIGYPVFVKPAYLRDTLRTACSDETKLRAAASVAFENSPIKQIMVEKGIAGWREISYTILRDARGNSITIGTSENIDPVGIHAGDSVEVVPAQTLSNEEKMKLETSAKHIAAKLNVHGVCHVQFAVHPNNGSYVVLRINPKQERQTALIGRVTGYPLAKASVLSALGVELPEEYKTLPTFDATAVKLAKWSFDKLKEADYPLDTARKSTGESIAVGENFESAFVKASRCVSGEATPLLEKFSQMNMQELLQIISGATQKRIFAVYAALVHGVDVNTLHVMTGFHLFFLEKLYLLAKVQKDLTTLKTKAIAEKAFSCSFPMSYVHTFVDKQEISTPYRGYKEKKDIFGQTAYAYSVANDENKLAIAHDREKVLVVGAGATTIEHGAELDYVLVHALQTLQKKGYYTILANNNPVAVSTLAEFSDKLYIEPLDIESLTNIIQIEKVDKVLLQFGGKTAIHMSRELEKTGIQVLGASQDLLSTTDSIEKMCFLLDECDIPHITYLRTSNSDDIKDFALQNGYPIRIRSKGYSVMAYNLTDIDPCYESVLQKAGIDKVLVERYLMATGIEVATIFDGKEILIPGLCEQIEKEGIHAGDAITTYPTRSLTENQKERIFMYSSQVAKALGVKGIVNFHFVLHNSQLYFLKADPTSVRSLTFLGKTIDLNISDIAVRAMLDESITDMGYTYDYYESKTQKVSTRVPVFSFNKVSGQDIQLGLYMKSTGEVMGLGHSFDEALMQGMLASGIKMRRSGAVFIAVRDYDKTDVIPIAEAFARLGFELYATAGTANKLNSEFIATNVVRKIHEGTPNTLDLLAGNKITYVISTSTRGNVHMQDDINLRRKAVQRGIPTFTSLDTAREFVQSLEHGMKDDENDKLELGPYKC